MFSISVRTSSKNTTTVLKKEHLIWIWNLNPETGNTRPVWWVFQKKKNDGNNEKLQIKMKTMKKMKDNEKDEKQRKTMTGNKNEQQQCLGLFANHVIH